MLTFRTPLELILITCFFLLYNIGTAQSRLQPKCETYLKKEEYEKGVDFLQAQDSVLKKNDPFHSYYMGMMYYHIPHKKKEATQFFQEYLDRTNDEHIKMYGHEHIYFFLGKMYHLNYEWDKAEEWYRLFIQKIDEHEYIPAVQKEILIGEAIRHIDQCDFGRIAVNNPRHVLIESLGDTINTIYPEYAAVVSQNEEKLIFTSRRPDTRGGKLAREGGGFYEDLYTAELVKGSIFENRDFLNDTSGRYYFNTDTDFEYINFRRMDDEINTERHDGSIQLHKDDKVLYFYHDEDVWSVRVDVDSTMKPEKLGEFVNSDYHEPSIFFSNDDSKLFIVSDRPGGFGGKDIYLSEREESGIWSEPMNLGPQINTEFDEDAPYFDPDGITLYFSSKGHSSMGEYDVFRCRLEDSIWTAPVNLGYPINTPADDIYFTMTSRYNRGYYSSSDLKGVGDMDLYRITFADERDPIAELFGHVKKEKGDLMVPTAADILLQTSDEERIKEVSDSVDGDYFLLLGYGKNYEMYVKTVGYVPYKREFSVPKQKEYYQLYQEVHMQHIRAAGGQVIGQEVTVYTALGNEEETVYYNEKTRKTIEKIKAENKITGDIQAHTEYHFYLTADELKEIMKNDTTLEIDENYQARKLMLKTNKLEYMKEDSYLEFEGSLSRDVFLNPDVIATTDAAQIDGLFFTVQIGVYSRNVPHSVLYNLEPLVTRRVNNNTLYRYSTGTYASFDEAQKRCDQIIKIGVEDAFVTAYYKGDRIGPEKAEELLKKFGNKILMKQ